MHTRKLLFVASSQIEGVCKSKSHARTHFELRDFSSFFALTRASVDFSRPIYFRFRQAKAICCITISNQAARIWQADALKQRQHKARSQTHNRLLRFVLNGSFVCVCVRVCLCDHQRQPTRQVASVRSLSLASNASERKREKGNELSRGSSGYLAWALEAQSESWSERAICICHTHTQTERVLFDGCDKDARTERGGTNNLSARIRIRKRRSERKRLL